MVRKSAGSLPNPADIYIGSRIRLRRNWCGLSQRALGNALGLTFQQVQKYENGTNRVGASRLFEICRVLEVPIGYFYDGMPEEMSDVPISGLRGRMPSSAEWQESPRAWVDDKVGEHETLALICAYYRISDHAIRRRMLYLIKSLAPSEANTPHG